MTDLQPPGPGLPMPGSSASSAIVRSMLYASSGTNAALRDAVAFWEKTLHPLTALALPTEPPPQLWDRIAAQLDGGASTRPALQLWRTPWRWSTAGFAAVTAALALYIALKPVPPAPSFVAILHAPQHEQANWVAMAGRPGLLVRAGFFIHGRNACASIHNLLTITAAGSSRANAPA
jgi:hypothetical protein